jgi:hypothetical protein
MMRRGIRSSGERMHRLSFWAAGAAGALLLAACAGAPMKTATPKGLLYDCAGEPAVVTFHGGGYLPDQSVRRFDGAGNLARYGDGMHRGQIVQTPRSTADLDYKKMKVKLVAEWAEEGLRFRSETPDDGHYWIWSIRGETARLGRRPAGLQPESEEQAGGDNQIVCRRAQRLTDPAAHVNDNHAAEEAHHDESGEPHRR